MNKLRVEVILVVLLVAWIFYYSHWAKEWIGTTQYAPVVKILEEDLVLNRCVYALGTKEQYYRHSGNCGYLSGDQYPVKMEWLPVVGFNWLWNWVGVSKGGFIGKHLEVFNLLYMLSYVILFVLSACALLDGKASKRS